MTATTTEQEPYPCTDPTLAVDESAHPSGSTSYDERVAALIAAYDRTVDQVMTARFGPGWATRGDLPDEAYTTETTFCRWLNDLLDHIEGAAAAGAPTGRI